MAGTESDDRLVRVVSPRLNLVVDATYGVHPAAGCVADWATAAELRRGRIGSGDEGVAGGGEEALFVRRGCLTGLFTSFIHCTALHISRRLRTRTALNSPRTYKVAFDEHIVNMTQSIRSDWDQTQRGRRRKPTGRCDMHRSWKIEFFVVRRNHASWCCIARTDQRCVPRNSRTVIAKSFRGGNAPCKSRVKSTERIMSWNE